MGLHLLQMLHIVQEYVLHMAGQYGMGVYVGMRLT
jgi:hypothetical protein